MTILVTGAAGFAGSHLLDMLAADNPRSERLVAWRRARASAVEPDRHAGVVDWQSMDLLDRDAVRKAITEVRPDAVYHCAGAAHVGRAWENTERTFAVNVRGTHNLLDALRGSGVAARVLIPSSALVYHPADRPLVEDDALVPSSPYGVSKLAQEMLACHSDANVDVVVARAFNHIGPRQDPFFAASGFARRIADIERGKWEPQISVGNLGARRDLTDVRDTVRAYRDLLTGAERSSVFNVCSGVAVEIREVLDRLIARARVAVSVKVDPARYRPNDTPLLVGDPSRIRTRFGWSPQIPLDRTLDDLLEYWRENG